MCLSSHSEDTKANSTQSGRLPYLGVPVSTEGQEHVPSVVGPLARSLNTLHLIIEETIKAEPWKYDAKVLPMPWRQEHYDEMLSRPLVIGMMIDDGVVKVHPPIERVLREVREKLETAGHEVVDWDASGHEKCIQIMVSLFMHKPNRHLIDSSRTNSTSQTTEKISAET